MSIRCSGRVSTVFKALQARGVSLPIFFCFTPHKTTSEVFGQIQAGRAIVGLRVGTEAFPSGFCACWPLPRFPEAHRRLAGWKWGGTRQRSASQPAGRPCCPGNELCSQVQLPRRLTSHPLLQSPGAWALQRNTRQFTGS